MDTFTPVASTLGGMLIGLSATMMLLGVGRIAGISGIYGGMLRPHEGDVTWRVAFLGGLLSGGLLLAAFTPVVYDTSPDRSLGAVILAGLLVGFGVRLGNGCTSGHGVCGLSRLSPRSLAATLTFMATGFATAAFVTLVLGGSV